jgi:putative DNA primase/helicase
MRARMAAMLECAGPHMRLSPDDFNADPLLVATQTHTLRFAQRPDPECPDPEITRLKWQIEAERVHRREDLITALVPVAYDPDADCPKWRANLARFQPNEKQRRTVQQFAGVGLLGKSIQRVMFHYGTGANFKSVFLETVTRVLGKSFAVGLPTESLIGGAEASAGGARPDLERVFGKRMLRILELPQGMRLKADLIKKLTGGEAWPVRTLYKSFFEFTPCAKTHMSGNDFPEFDGSDGGMQRRLIVMEWPVTIAEADQLDIDIVLADLLTEAPGILNWLIEGALDYLENSLVVSDETRAFTKEYFDEMDPAANFVRDCVSAEPGHSEKARDMYKAYVAHCAANARKPVFETRFGRVLKKKFKRDDSGRVRLYVDIRLHDVPEISQDDQSTHHADRGAAEEFV